MSYVETLSNKFVVREQTGRNWNKELLHFEVSFPAGSQKDDKLAFTAGQGGLVPTQITDIKPYRDGSIASATAWCLVDLNAGQTLTLELVPKSSPAHPDKPLWRAGKECIEVGNSILSARVPVSGTYAADSVPGPVLAVRLGDGQWMGQGRVVASSAVVLSTQLISHGPLFVHWRTTMAYERATLARFDCIIYSGEDIVRVEETTNFDSDLCFELDLFPGLRPDRMLNGGGGHCWNLPNTRELDYARSEELGIVDFNSGNHQMSLVWIGAYRQGADPFIGVIELDGTKWTNLATNRLHLQMQPPESLVLVSPLKGGRKVYAILCCKAELNTEHLPGKKYNHLNEVYTRQTGLPLQKAKDWVLQWDEDQTPRPYLQTSGDVVTKARAMAQSHDDIKRVYMDWAKALRIQKNPDAAEADDPKWSALASKTHDWPSIRASIWVALGHDVDAKLASGQLDSMLEKTVDRLWKQGMLLDLIIFDGRQMKGWLQAYDLLKAAGFIDADRDARIKRNFAFLAYCFEDEEFFPHTANLRDLNDPDSFYGGLGRHIGDAMCPPNFHTEYYSTFGMMGCAFRGHPRAATWRKVAAALFDRQLERHYYDSGAYCESPNYHTHSFTMLTQLALSLRQAGEQDFFQHPRFKQQFEHFTRIQTPQIVLNDAAREHYLLPWRYVDIDPDHRFSMVPGNGNSGTSCSDQPMPSEMAVGAAIYSQSDPELSRRCMTTWRRAGRPCSSTHNDLTFLLLVDPDLPGEDTLGLASEVRTGSFVTMRGKPETSDEVFVLVKNGTATHHNDFDEGGFTIWAYGSPLASDFGYHTVHDGKMQGAGGTRHHNCVEFDDKNCGYLGIEQTLPPERFITSDLADLLVSYLPNTNLRWNGYLDSVPVERIEHRRYTLFVKPHYLLVFDSILQCRYSHKWFLHAQASDVKIDGQRARFAGKFGVDLLAQFIVPGNADIHTGEFGVMKHIYAKQGMANDWRVFVAPLKNGQDFEVSAQAGGRVAHVRCSEYQDTVFLAHHSFGFEDGKLRFDGRAGIVRTFADGRKQTQLLDGTVLEA